MAANPEQGIINTKQYVWIHFIIIASFTVLQVPGLLIFQAGRDAWLSVTAAWFFDLVLAIVFAYMSIRFPGQNYIQYGPTIIGKTWGKIFGVLFILFFLIVSVTVMRGLGLYIGNIFLPRTPLSVALLGAYLVIAYMIRKGVETIARIGEILGPIFLLSLILLFLGAFPFVHFERLKPQLDLGYLPFISGIPIILSYLGICLSMGWFIPVCNRPENGFKAKFIALNLGVLVICLVIVFSIGIFGVEQAGNMINPGLQIARIIHVEAYLERMEVLWMVIVIGAGIMMASSALWIFCLSVAQITKLDTYKPLVFPSALLSYALCIGSFSQSTDYLAFLFYSFPILGLVVEMLPVWLLVGAWVTGKRGRQA